MLGTGPIGTTYIFSTGGGTVAANSDEMAVLCRRDEILYLHEVTPVIELDDKDGGFALGRICYEMIGFLYWLYGYGLMDEMIHMLAVLFVMMDIYDGNILMLMLGGLFMCSPVAFSGILVIILVMLVNHILWFSIDTIFICQL